MLGEIGVSPGEGTGATMSEDEDEQVESDAHLHDGSLDGLGFGPLVPTESERSLMERVRQELKHELKQVTNDIYYLHHIVLHIVSSVKLHCPLFFKLFPFYIKKNRTVRAIIYM